MFARDLGGPSGELMMVGQERGFPPTCGMTRG
jgi:hypothetical protein